MACGFGRDSDGLSKQKTNVVTRSFNRRPSGPSKAMKLGSKAKDVDSFVDQLKSEGESKQFLYQIRVLNSKEISALPRYHGNLKPAEASQPHMALTLHSNLQFKIRR